METHLCAQILSRLLVVLTVPMRNGNNQILRNTTPKTRVLTVPMRNGNFSDMVVGADIYSSYRTYEEWKPCKSSKAVSNCPEFLPYLWGMETINAMKSSSGCVSSYRTYEEWKLAFGSKKMRGNIAFLPYLWGMETTSASVTRQRNV